MYINIDTNQYPLSESQIRATHPNTSFPQPFTPPDGYIWVFPLPAPTYDPISQFVRETAPELTSKGHWEQRWEIVKLDPETTQLNHESKIATASENVRLQRNRLLSESDWTQLPDAPVDIALWATYRQQLRDITAQSGFPLEVTWPQPPV